MQDGSAVTGVSQKPAWCGGKSMGAGGSGGILALPPTCCVTSGKSLTFSVSFISEREILGGRETNLRGFSVTPT